MPDELPIDPFFPLTLEELFLPAVLFVALYGVGLPTFAVLSDRYRSNLILLELIVPRPESLLVNQNYF